MPDPLPPDVVTHPEPPPKRRRVYEDDGADSARCYSSPDDNEDVTPRSLSIRPAQRSRSNSLSSKGNTDRYRSVSVSSRNSQSRTRRRLSPSYSESRSRSRRRARSGSHTDLHRSRSVSRSRSHSRSSRSPSRISQSSTSTSRQHSREATPSTPADAKPLPPPRPDYKLRIQLQGHPSPISQVRISPDGRWIASASADGTAKIWDALTGAHMDTLVGHMAGISCIAWSPDSNTLATGSDDKAIRLWDRVTAGPAHACGEGVDGTSRVRGTGAGAGQGRSVVGTGIRGGRTGRGPLLGHHNYVYSLAFSPKGNILASGSYDEAVFLWDVRAGRLMRSLPAHSDPVSGVDFCRDGTLVVSCSTDGLIRIWDTSTGQCLRTLVHEDNPAVANVCFSPNGRFVLAFSLDNSIRLWDYVSGSVKKTYQGHVNRGFSIGGSFGVLTDVDQDGNPRSTAFVASASEDGDIVLWDVKSKEIVQRISQAHKGVCFWVDVHGDIMVSAGKDGIIKLYRNKIKGRAIPGNTDRTNGEAPVNGGANGHTQQNGSPYRFTMDEELQRQVEAEDALQVKQEYIKTEEA
ncbi:hypothetical protein VTK73DRAFT_3280 [Phialemonium thermophilum]|uniref:Mitochondrial division protein 1 n=1 Tax=Phialemonium thermophilum TaxID=223376 RepID=A0ABR3Y7K9_9PEZI